MTQKGFRVNVQLDLHAITCPGVWLCPNGKVALRITSLGSTLESHRVSPIFPLLFHNEFNFKKTFTRLAALTELQWNLEQELLYAELIQWIPCNKTVVLATFETNLADVLYPMLPYKGLLAGVEIDLLMDPTAYFPGIIAPKIEISTKTTIEEVLGIPDENSADRAFVVSPKTINSKRTPCIPRKRPVKGIIRQRKVCHSRAKPRAQHCRPAKYRCCVESNNTENSSPRPRINVCYRPARGTPICLCNVNAKRNECQVPSLCDEAHMFESCPVCSKYKCYFSCKHDESKAELHNLHRRKENSESFKHDSCCCACALCNEYVSRVSSSLAQREDKHLRKRSYCDDSNCKAKDVSGRIPLCMCDRNEARQGFYKNLERFYKRMYKHAKVRAQEANY